MLAGAIGLNIPFSLDGQPAAKVDGDRLVLLGTQGGPFIRSYKQTPSANLIVYNNVVFVIDTGYGVTFRLREAGISLSRINHIFITHNHSDHNLELGILIYNTWIAGLSTPIHVYGPAGIKNLLHHFWDSNSFDINTRIEDEGRPDIKKLVIIHEITEGPILSEPLTEVNALRNIHPPVKDSFAFRFKLGARTIVFSGDTAYCEELSRFALGADYLVHEVMYQPAIEEMLKNRPNATKLKASILSHHTSPEDAGKLATAGKVKNLVLNHFVPPDDKMVSDQTWLNAARSTFKGNIIIGKDLLTLPL